MSATAPKSITAVRPVASVGQGQLPPHDEAAERATLGTVLYDGARLPIVREALSASDYYSGRHRRIFEAICALADEKLDVDVASVGAWLRERNRLEAVDGMGYLTELVTGVAVWSDRRVIAAAGIVRVRAEQRALLALSQGVAAQLYLGVPIDEWPSLLSDVVEEIRKASGGTPSPTGPSPKLGTILDESLARVDRRCDGAEKPVPLPWPVLDEHFGGGLWPGLHIIVAGTGLGKTAAALQTITHAARNGFPGLYVGLELAALDVGVRAVGEAANVPWSALWTGQAGPAWVTRAHDAADGLRDLPIHVEVSRPHGMAVSELRSIVENFRATYPETAGQGSRPLLLVVDFLQLIGDETGDEQELRIRIGRASYALRDFATRLNIAVLAISSVARTHYRLDLLTEARLAWDEDENGCPINRRILNTDAIIGSGKESGDIEYSADSVTIMSKVAGTWDEHGVDVVVATAKGRATGAMWSPLRFTGFRYEECSDRGGRVLEAWNATTEKRAAAREEKQRAKEEAKGARAGQDADTLRAYVAAHPGCSVREARVAAVGDVSARWSAAVALLGTSLVQTRTKGNGPAQLSLVGVSP